MTDELRADGASGTLHLEREYDTTPEQMWDAWTDPERLARWLAPASGPLLSADHAVRLTFGDGAGEWADVTVVAAAAPHRLELRWAFTGDVVSELRVEIVAAGETRVRVVLDHRGLGDSTVGYGAGWEAYLARLGGEFGPAPTASWDELFAAALPAWQQRATAAG